MTAAKTGSQKHTANDDGALDVREPAVAYRVGGSAVAELDDEVDWDGEEDYGAPESVTVHSYEELCQSWRKPESRGKQVRCTRLRIFGATSSVG